MGQRKFVLELTDRELLVILRAVDFIEAGGGIDEEPIYDQQARERIRDKIHNVTQPKI